MKRVNVYDALVMQLLSFLGESKKKNGNQQMIKTPITVARVLTAFFL